MTTKRRASTRSVARLFALAAAIVAMASAASAQVSRTAPTIAEVVTVKGDEEALLVEAPAWIPAAARQRLLGGDRLRTGELGGLALLFDDRTQLRLHANTQLRLRAADADVGLSLLGLDFGRLWGRSIEPDERFVFETPTATASVRGTDWYVDVADNGATRLLVLDGEIALSNPFGAVTVAAGEVGLAEPGEPPRKEVVIDSAETARWALGVDLTTFELDADAPEGLGALREAAALLEQGRVVEGAALLEPLAAISDDWRAPALLAWLEAYAGRTENALERIESLRQAHPRQAELAVLASLTLVLRGAFTDAVAAARAAVRLDPGSFRAWHFLGLAAAPRLDRLDEAEAAFERSRDLNDEFAPTLANLAQIAAFRGDYRRADGLYQRALTLAPSNPVVIANYVTFLLEEDRLDEAMALLSDASAAPETGSALLLLTRSYAAHRQGLFEEAVAWSLRAQAVNPGIPFASQQLAAALADRNLPGDRDAARAALDTEARLNPNDPVGPLFASIIANERFQIEEAIAQARISRERVESGRGGLSLANVIGQQTGASTLGAAYAALGFLDWAEYYDAAGDSPFSANAQFANARSANNPVDSVSLTSQGLLLDPLSFAIPNRFTPFTRAPATYRTVGGSMAISETGATVDGDVVVSGFRRGAAPFSFNLAISGEHAFENEDRDAANGERTVTNAFAGFGARLTPEDYVSFRGSLQRDRGGAPGFTDFPDPDDYEDDLIGVAEFGYQKRFALDDRFAARLNVRRRVAEDRNDQPFGSGLSSFEAGLVDAVGPIEAQRLDELGLLDATAGFRTVFGFPVDGTTIVAQPSDELNARGITGVPLLLNINPALIDQTEEIGSRTDEWDIEAQLRRFGAIGPIDWSVGLEGGATVQDARLESNVLLATGAPALVGELRPPTEGGFRLDAAFFPADIVAVESNWETHLLFVEGHAHGAWSTTETLTAEAGVFVFGEHASIEFDTGFEETETRLNLDPRAGLAWRPMQNTLFRLGAQRRSSPFSRTTLAPIGAAGLTPHADQINEAQRLDSIQARIDREWSSRIFTFVEAEAQWLDQASLTLPGEFAFEETQVIDGASIARVELGAAMRFGARAGLSLRYERMWTRNRSDGEFLRADGTGLESFEGNDLPFIPEHAASATLTYIDPVGVVASIGVNWTGERKGDFSNETALGDEFTVDLGVSWRPPETRDWLISATVENALDADASLAPRIAGDGFAATLTVVRQF